MDYIAKHTVRPKCGLQECADNVAGHFPVIIQIY
jgi:hypothetical protein